LALFAAACGGGGDAGEVADAPATAADAPAAVADVLAAVDGLDPEAREAKLLELARAEGGTLTWYTTTAEDDYPTIVDAFEAAYGLEVSVFRGRPSELIGRITEERDAGVAGADVLATGSEHMAGLSDVLGPYSAPYQEGLPEGASGDEWTGYAVSFRAPSWNTDLLEPDDVPTTWDDLADPRWKGVLAIDPNEVEWYAALHTYLVEEEGRAEAEVDELFEQIAANAVFLAGHTAQAQLLAAGEFELGVNATSLVDGLAAEGAPIAWQPPVEPVVAGISGAGVLSTAAHPAAAVLFVDWLMSDGQAALAEINDVGVTELDDLGMEYVLLDPAELAASFDGWSERFEQLARLGEVREVEEG
jgi:iron(III) transport system substrate-binding protein